MSLFATVDAAPPLLPTTMTRGKPLSDDLRVALICMGRQLPLNTVSKYSGVPVRTIKRLFSDYRRDGHALRRKQHVEMRGAKQKLMIDDMGVRSKLLSAYI